MINRQNPIVHAFIRSHLSGNEWNQQNNLGIFEYLMMDIAQLCAVAVENNKILKFIEAVELFLKKGHTIIRNVIIFHLFHHEFDSMHFSAREKTNFLNFSSIIIFIHHWIQSLFYAASQNLENSMRKKRPVFTPLRSQRRINSWSFGGVWTLYSTLYMRKVFVVFPYSLRKYWNAKILTSFVALFFSRCNFSQENGELSMKNSTIATYCAVQCNAMQCMTCTLTSIHNVHNVYTVQQQNTWHLYRNLVRQINRSMISISVSIASRMQ